MTQPISKTKQAILAYERGDIKETLKIVSTFRIGLNKNEQTILKRGYEMMVNPEIYKQMGFKKKETVDEATNLFEDRFLWGNMYES